MTGWLALPNFVLTVAALLLMALGLLLALLSPGLEKWNRRFFAVLFSLMVLCVAVGLAEELFSLSPERVAMTKYTLFAESLIASILPLLLTVYLLHCCGEFHRKSGLLYAMVGLWLVYFALLTVTQFTTFIYYFTPDNRYFRGPWYPVLLAPPVAMMAVNLCALLIRRKKLTRRQFAALLIYVAVPMAAMIVQMFFYGLYIIGLGMAVASLFMFLFILTDSIDQSIRQQEEIARQQREIARNQQEIANQRASIMVLQMRPHLIYNTLTSIYCLCKQNPDLAQKVIMDFTTYLRKNFTAVASDKPIPFTAELEHTRAYLAVEQAQYEDRLFVDYDTPHTMFRVPPLTLQPIVENAVKHGMNPDSDPLRISIRTRKTKDGSEIAVTDNGCGFHLADGSEPHIALKNIQQRLELMCGGSLAVAPNDGGGTVVTVTIPDRTTK